ncbi:hypothetical protein [Ochrobactrum soli]|uniref:hypothetical protein n=1 Tax=Ochrobactrum soli TaxID=2448455 RepID=UPI0011C41A37|nr:hypothetical protein [[Ochrobactrum] soli]
MRLLKVFFLCLLLLSGTTAAADTKQISIPLKSDRSRPLIAIIADHYVMTTTGVTASIPASLALVEAISGSVNAKVIARKLGVEDWNYAHVSAPFHLTAAHIGLVARNYLSFWKHETLSIPVAGSFDEIALALSADAWSRTYRSQAVAISKSDRVKSRVPH